MAGKGRYMEEQQYLKDNYSNNQCIIEKSEKRKRNKRGKNEKRKRNKWGKRDIFINVSLFHLMNKCQPLERRFLVTH